MKPNYIIVLILVAALAFAGYFFLIRKPAETPKSDAPTSEITKPTIESAKPDVANPTEQKPVEAHKDANPGDGHALIDSVYDKMNQLVECLKAKKDKLPPKEKILQACTQEDLEVINTTFQCLLDKGICKMGDLMEKIKNGEASLGETEMQFMTEMATCEAKDIKISKSCENIGGL